MSPTLPLGDADRRRCDLEWLRTTKLAAASRNQVAEVFHVDPRTVTRAVKNGELPSVHIAGRVLIPLEPLRRLLGVEAAHSEP